MNWNLYRNFVDEGMSKWRQVALDAVPAVLTWVAYDVAQSLSRGAEKPPSSQLIGAIAGYMYYIAVLVSGIAFCRASVRGLIPAAISLLAFIASSFFHLWTPALLCLGMTVTALTINSLVFAVIGPENP